MADNTVKFVKCTKQEFSQITPPDNVIYFIEDTGEIYKGSQRFSISKVSNEDYSNVIDISDLVDVDDAVNLYYEDKRSALLDRLDTFFPQSIVDADLVRFNKSITGFNENIFVPQFVECLFTKEPVVSVVVFINYSYDFNEDPSTPPIKLVLLVREAGGTAEVIVQKYDDPKLTWQTLD